MMKRISHSPALNARPSAAASSLGLSLSSLFVSVLPSAEGRAVAHKKATWHVAGYLSIHCHSLLPAVLALLRSSKPCCPICRACTPLLLRPSRWLHCYYACASLRLKTRRRATLQLSAPFCGLRGHFYRYRCTRFSKDVC